jgi:hypothetical protein
MAEVIKLNNQDYIFEGFVFTGDQNTGEFQKEITPLSYQNIGSIEINDTLFNFDYSGNIIFKNQYNILENLVNFKANNRAGMFIRLSPSEVSSISTQTPTGIKALDISFWSIFNNTTSINSEKSNSTVNLIDFISPTDASLRETKASALNNGDIPSPFQIKGDINLGEYIKEILTIISGKPANLKLYKDGELTDDINGDQTLVYQVPLHYNLNDLLTLLLKLYIVQYNGIYTQCVLLHDQKSDTYILVPFTAMLENIPPRENNETFIIGSQGNDQPSSSPTVVAAKRNQQNVISGYSFSDVVFNVSNSHFTDICIVSDELTSNVNSIVYLKIKDVISKINQNIIGSLTEKGYSNPSINIDLDDTKSGTEAKNFKVVSFPYQNINHTATAEAILVGDIIFNNMELMFTTNGAPYRRSGVFINIERDQLRDSDVSQQYKNIDSKVLGQWLVVEVVHKFIEDKYINVIKCVKPFRGSIN